MLAQSVFRIEGVRLDPIKGYTQSMKIRDESIEEIDEALAHLSNGIRHAGDFRKQHLLDLVDQMLDAKLGMNQ